MNSEYWAISVECLAKDACGFRMNYTLYSCPEGQTGFQTEVHTPGTTHEIQPGGGQTLAMKCVSPLPMSMNEPVHRMLYGNEIHYYAIDIPQNSVGVWLMLNATVLEADRDEKPHLIAW